MMKKRINSKSKGNRAELELAKILTKRFGMPFARVGVSSGARPKQVKLDGTAKQAFTSDLIVPDGFRFSVECKAVNKDVDLLDQSALLDKFLQQAADDANSIKKVPMLCWKRNRKGWLAILPERYVFGKTIVFTNYYSVYREWVVCYLDALLETEQPDFWFDNIDEGVVTPSILEQFERSCTTGKGDIVCPRCRVEIGKFAASDDAYDLVSQGLCPICECNLDEGRGEQEWCEFCKVPCEDRIELDKQWDHEWHLCDEADARRKYG
jgi:hypothetical protein